MYNCLRSIYDWNLNDSIYFHKMMNPIEKIDSIELYIVKIPLVNSFETSLKKITHKEALLIKINAGDYSGWGECGADIDPFYYHETIKTVLYITEEFLFPILFKKKNLTIKNITFFFSVIRGYNMAKAMIENALIDLIAKTNKLPVYKLIGGTHKDVMSGISIGIKKDTNSLLFHVEKSIADGYHRIKIKIKKEKDIKTLRAIRKEFPDTPLMVDANGDYTYDDVETLKQFDEFKLMMIEQPFEHNDIYEHSILQKSLKTPICLDESITGIDRVKTAIHLKSCKIINIKQSRVGGILNAKMIQNYCVKNNIDAWSGGMLETGIGRAFNLHIQTLPGYTLPGDTSATSRYFHEDIVTEPIVLNSRGYIKLPEGDGIGVEVIQSKIEKHKVFYRKIKP